MSLDYQTLNSHYGIPEPVVVPNGHYGIPWIGAEIDSMFAAKKPGYGKPCKMPRIIDYGSMNENDVNDYLAKLHPEKRKAAEKFMRAVLKAHKKSRKKGGKK